MATLPRRNIYASLDRISYYMVTETTRDEMTWYECEHCGLLFDSRESASQHEANCDAEEPSYIQ